MFEYNSVFVVAFAMRRKPQQKRSEQMLSDILQAALEAASEQGVDRVTTRHVADRAGISVGTLYHYFANKQEIMAALEKRFVMDLLADLQTATPDIVRLEIGEAVRCIAGVFYTRVAQDDGRWLILMRQLLRRGVELGHELERYFNQLGLLYVNQHPDLAQVRDFPKVVYILLNACAFNLMRVIESPPPAASVESLIEGLVDMTVAYVDSQRPPGTKV